MNKTVLVLAAAAIVPAAGFGAFRADSFAGEREGKKIAVAVDFSAGMLNGEGNEHVYDYEVDPGNRYQLSRLDWELKDVWMGGCSISIRLLDRLTVNAGAWTALTEGGGEMEDYDWLLPEYSPEWSDYSLSEVDVTAGYVLDANVAWDFVRRETLVLRGLAGYKQDGWTWEDRGQYAIYSSDYGFRDEYWDFGGENGINYEQLFRMPYVGASADWRWKEWTVSGYATYSPLVSASDWDEHVARDTYFKETFEDGEMVGAGLKIRYDFAENFLGGAFAFASVDYQAVDLIVGDSEMREGFYGEKETMEDGAGIENEYTAFSVGGGLRF